MDAQIRKGLLEFCVLAALRQGDSYGYQLLKDIPEYIASLFAKIIFDKGGPMFYNTPVLTMEKSPSPVEGARLEIV